MISIDLAKAYKVLLARNQRIESVLKETTPLQSLHSTTDFEAFEEYLRSIKVKSDLSTEEIGRLTRECDGMLLIVFHCLL
jgi:hypothetical protein